MSVKLRKRKRASGNYSLYLDIYSQGKRQNEFLNLYLTNDRVSNKEVLKLAESIRSKRQLEIQNEQHGFVSSLKKKANFIDYFVTLVNERPADRSSWYCTQKKLETFTSGYIQFSDVNEVWLKSFQSFLLNEVGQCTAYHYYSNVKYALNRAVKDKIIAVNPAVYIKNIKKPDIKKEFLTFEEIKKLANTECSSEIVKQAFLFSCFTGLRLSDVKKIRFSDIKNNTIDYVQKKTDRQEYLPLSTTAQNIINKRKLYTELESDPLIFNLQTKSIISGHIRKWVKKAELNKRITFHSARHTFATLSITQGVDLYTVSKLLGHKDISTTQVYAKIVDSKKNEAMDKLPKLEL